jgi:hypothetical protein
MARFLGWWLLCGVVYAPLRLLLGYLLAHQVDLRFGSFADLVLVPAVQALALTVLAGRRPAAAGAATLDRRALGSAVVVLVVVAVVPPLVASVFSDGPQLGPGVVTRTARAGLLMVGALFWWWTRGAPAGRSRLAVAAGMAAFGVDALWPWRVGLPSLLPETVPLVFRWLVTYGPLFVLALAVVATLAVRLRAAGELAPAWLLEVALGTAVLGALVVVFGYFRRPFLLPTAAAVVTVASHLTVAALCSAGAFAWFGARADAGSVPSGEAGPGRGASIGGEVPG